MAHQLNTYAVIADMDRYYNWPPNRAAHLSGPKHTNTIGASIINAKPHTLTDWKIHYTSKLARVVNSYTQAPPS